MAHGRARLGRLAALIVVGSIAAGPGRADWPFGASGRKRPITVGELSRSIAEIEAEVFRSGTISVKAPDVWSQSRLFKFRVEYERAMAAEVGKSSSTLNAIRRTGESEAIDLRLNVGAAASARPVSSSSEKPGPPTDPAAVKVDGPIVASVDKAEATTSAAASGAIGLDPLVRLDEKSEYLNHLRRLRQINAGDDLSDLPGYGLYMIRTPVALFPNPNARQYAAVVTFHAEPVLTPDVLPRTFREVVIADAAYQIKALLCPRVRPDRDEPAGPTSRRVVLASGGPPRERGEEAVTRIVRSHPGGIAPGIPYSELADLYGEENLRILVEGYRRAVGPNERDADVVPWLRTELAAAYHFLSNEAARGPSSIDDEMARSLTAAALARNYPEVARLRTAMLDAMVRKRMVVDGGETPAMNRRVVDVLVMVLAINAGFAESLLREDIRTRIDDVKSQLREEIRAPLFESVRTVEFYRLRLEAARRSLVEVGARKGDPTHLRRMVDDYESAIRYYKRRELYLIDLSADLANKVEGLSFRSPRPALDACLAFNAYVRAKWPLRVFTVDPTLGLQNQANASDLSRRTSLSGAAGVPVGLAAPLGLDARSDRTVTARSESIDARPTVVGFGSGSETFGWRFFPRTRSDRDVGRKPSGLADLLTGGRDRIEFLPLEAGHRECAALIVVPNFLPAIRFTTYGEWLRGSSREIRQDSALSVKTELNRRLSQVKEDLNLASDEAAYPPETMTVLRDRVRQLESNAAVRSFVSAVPSEPDLNGSGVFDPGWVHLAPVLLDWHGMPTAGRRPGEAGPRLVLEGKGFGVHETRVLVGGIEARADLLSRNLMLVELPAEADLVRRPAGGSHVEVQVVTPNGISNPLLVEVVPPEGAARPVSSGR